MIGGQKWSVILEILWLAHYNSEINWKIGEVKITRCLEKYEKQQKLKQGKLKWQKQKKEEKKKEEEKKQEEKKKKKGEKKIKKEKDNGCEESNRRMGNLGQRRESSKVGERSQEVSPSKVP